LTGTPMEPEIMLDWLNDAMEGLYIPLKGTEVMQSGVDRIGLGVGRYMVMWCQSIESFQINFQISFQKGLRYMGACPDISVFA